MIYDTNGNRILSANIALESEEVKTFTIRIDCNTDYFLRSEAVADLTVEARKSGDVSWTNIETTPIDLSADDGNFIDYEIRLTAPVVTSHLRRLAPFTVGR